MNLVSEEIYPYIVVYNNVFEDIDKMYQIAKNIKESEEGIFENWKPWYEFGEKIENFGINFDRSVRELKLAWDHKVLETDKEKDQQYFIYELVKGFHKVNNDFISRFNLDIDTSHVSNPTNSLYSETNDSPQSKVEEINTWRWTGPSLCKYFDDAGKGLPLSMNYHSDFIREPIRSPGYKFAITTTTYLNDNYDGGEVEFIINNKIFDYKPKAGDFLVFPSGHPEILTEDGKVYLHGVKNNTNGEKLFTRMYWQKYYVGDKEWFENEEKYGRDEWIAMQKEIMAEYMEKVQRKNLDGLVRIK